MTDHAVEIAVVKQSLTEFKERYERDQAEFCETYRADQREAKEHRAEVMARLDQISAKEQQAIGAMKMARVGYWVLSVLGTALMALGLPKIGAWLMTIAR